VYRRSNQIIDGISFHSVSFLLEEETNGRKREKENRMSLLRILLKKGECHVSFYLPVARVTTTTQQQRRRASCLKFLFFEKEYLDSTPIKSPNAKG
jgi:hypothetical protein